MNINRIKQLSGIVEDRTADWQSIVDIQKKLDSAGFKRRYCNSRREVYEYGFDKEYEVMPNAIHNGIPTTFTAIVNYRVDNESAVVDNIYVTTYYEYYNGSEYSTGPAGKKTTQLETIDQAISFANSYFVKELGRHKNSMLDQLTNMLQHGFIRKFVRLLNSYKRMGLTWQELQASHLINLINQCKTLIIKDLLTRYKRNPNDDEMQESIDILKNEFSIDWPELAVIEKSYNASNPKQ